MKDPREALRPCPFCGGAAVLEGKSDYCRVRCESCCTEGPSASFDGDCDDDAIERAEASVSEAWNRRAAPDAPADPATTIDWAETRRLAAVALRESNGDPPPCNWMSAALKVCRAVAASPPADPPAPPPLSMSMFATRADYEAAMAAAPPQAATDAEYQFEVWQNDEVLAWGGSGNVESMRREAGHYAMQYAQDGPVEVLEYVRYPLAAAPAPTSGKDGT